MNQEITSQTQKRNQFNGIIVIAVIAVPMLLAYIIFKTGVGMPAGTSNKGVLLDPPLAIQTLPLGVGEAPFSWASLYDSHTKRWRMLIPVAKQCDACEGFLYLTRQVHIRLANKAYRVERILVLLDEFTESELADLQQAHPETHIIHSSINDLQSWLSPVDLPKTADHYFYLIDQQGNAMMRYGVEHSGQDILADLKKLLKFTYDK